MEKYTILETRKKLGLSRSAMDGVVARGEIGTVVIGKRRYVTREQLEAYVNDGVQVPTGHRKYVDDTILAPGENASIVERVNDELREMRQMMMTAREEALIEALARALRK